MNDRYEFLREKFLEAMNDIGRYGFQKYGRDSFQFRAASGDASRGSLQRCQPESVCLHGKIHFDAYLHGEPHDHFRTRKHQLAAAAFNAMMEFYFAGLEDEL
jgi:phosphatidylserine/phosphatidylglycerophosphate/cardiolipin synthase-like enzyme